MTMAYLGARGRQLEELAVGLAREVVRVREANDPILYRDRQAYLKGLQAALAGVDAARIALALACQRLKAQTARVEAPWGRTS